MADNTERNLEEWNEYKKKFKKSYSTEEEDQQRMKLFLESKRSVEEHNEKYRKGETTYKMGMNQFSDWLPEERQRLSGLRGLDASDSESK